MQTSNYIKVNNYLGWIIWAIATFTYVATVAPTTSFWDCGEYIATSVKLQVGHPPGAPLFQLVGNVFSQFAGDVTQQAYAVNLLSALSSSFSILFLFWTITHLAKKLILRTGGELNKEKIIAIFGSGVVGALAFTWSDSFWYSAVEGEVYAMSSFFTAVAFWAVTKWERAFDEHDPFANRWLVLIAYLIGLSVGVHILVFLAIPPIFMVVYYKMKPNATLSDSVVGTVLSVIVLGAVFKLIIPLLLTMFGKLEILFVNSFTLPKNSGTIFSIFLIAGAAYFGMQQAKKRKNPFISQGIHAILFILIGYSSFVMLGIRSNAGTPIDENNPEDALSMLDYYNRVQYGDWPVMYGKTYNAQQDPQTPYVSGDPTYYYSEEEGKYLVADAKEYSLPNYDSKYEVFFPRIWSDQKNHVINYKQLTDLNIQLDERGNMVEGETPSFADNFQFFMNYQVGHMYWRYFLWNFVGRQNDIQHRYEAMNGNYITGIAGLDNARLGDQELLPDYMKDNPARNMYFAIPFILGLLGLGYQAYKDGKDAWVIGMFFLFTGLAIVVYTNHKPFEPRERDYAFVGSFYVFAIWIGLSVIAAYDLIRQQLKVPQLATLVTLAFLIIAPINMVAQNWDDHDRSERYMARDTAKAYLDSCEPNSILFTNGDNDTFPLWYMQEVEGYRTDVRIVNLSLLNTDWYIEQLKRSAHEDGNNIEFNFEESQYRQGTRDVVYYNPVAFQMNFGRQAPSGRWTVDQLMDWVKQDGDKFTFKPARGGQELAKAPTLNYYPVNKFLLDIDKEAVLNAGVVDIADSSRIVDQIEWNYGGTLLAKRDLMVMDLINQNNWERPIYFSVTVGSSPSAFFNLHKYLRLEGLAYRFVPIETEHAGGVDFGYVDTDLMYKHVMSWEFEGLNDPDVYYDETCRRPVYNLRNTYGRLAIALSNNGEKEKAREVLDRAVELMPFEKFEFNEFSLKIVQGYYGIGEFEIADAMVIAFADQLDQELNYYMDLSADQDKNQYLGYAMRQYQQIYQMSDRAHRNRGEGTTGPVSQRFMQWMQMFQG